jgi:PAS domain S-box-containing protein
MNTTALEQEIKAVYQSLESMYRRNETLEQDLLADALEKLAATVKDLRVVGEKLHQQNEELIANRSIVEAERQRYKELFNFAPDGYLITGPTGIIQEANIAIAELLNLSQNDLAGKPLAMFVVPEDRKTLGVKLNHLAQGHRVKEWEMYLQNEGVRFDAAITVAPVYDAEGGLSNLRWMIRDTTERKRAEDELRIKEFSIASSINGIAIMDLSGNLTYVNPSFLQMWGFTYELEVLGTSLLQLWQDKTAAQTILENLQSKKSYLGELAGKRRNGVTFYAQVSASVVTDRDGNAICLQSSFVDITEQKKAEEDLKRTAENLKRSNQDLERFAYVASHDLQEPLRAVVSYTQLLARRYQGKLDTDADEYIGFVVEGATRMQTLINDLLEFSRLTTRTNIFKTTDCEVLIREAVDNLQHSAEETGAVITHDPLPTVMADPSQLMQVFQNLIGNAIKFHGADPPRIHVSAEHADHHWLFSVTDNGIGIEPEYYDRIFIIFQRLHNRTQYPGTGIGLALCKKIVERHDGRIWVESEPGKGSTFLFTIPDVNPE